MMRVVVCGVLAALTASAAAVRGTVVENSTGKLLARAVVLLQAMPGTQGGERSVRTDRLGSFEFRGLPAGAYMLKASRRGLMPIEHGQKRWNSAGRPLILEEQDAPYVTLRLPRYSAISGTVVDENEIGLPASEASVFRATQPPEHVRDATSNDRGVYRVGGLEPGKYIVRTVGKQVEDDSYLPTYARETSRADQAQVIELFTEHQAEAVDVRPLQGKLITLNVSLYTDDPEIVLTVASPAGRKSVKAWQASFGGLPPGEFEIYAESPSVSSYLRASISESRSIGLMPLPSWEVAVSGGPNTAARLRMRRKDLAGVGPEFEAELVPNRPVPAPPGRWELLLEPPEGYYVASAGSYGRRGRLDGWIEETSRSRFSFDFRLTSGAGSIGGIVKEGAYAPVYLEGYDRELRKRVGDLRVVRADSRGNFRFGSLAPGIYRVVSTFEYLMPSTEILDSIDAVMINLGTGNTNVTKELELYVIR